VPVVNKSSEPIVCIILSTFNGSRFLQEQLDSLAGQSRRPDRLVLRDDGSTDNSVEIVRRWAGNQRIVLQEISGPPLGPASSFLTATTLAAPADIFMYCDQDDVWGPHKIARALRSLSWGDNSRAELLATRLKIVGRDLQVLRLSDLPRSLSFQSAACESLLTGCTMAFNASFRELLIKELPLKAAMHDWWLYMVATGLRGVRLHFDAEPTLLYRQHGGNVLGAAPMGFTLLKIRAKRFLGTNLKIRSSQLHELKRIYADGLTPEALILIDQLTSGQDGLVARFKAASIAAISRQSIFSTLATRVAILANRF
jgi:glycosyltransferase involved in cell wall biosynthesis